METKDAAVFISVAVSVTALILQLANARYQRSRDRGGDLEKLKASVQEMQVGYAVLRAQADIYWSKTTRSTAQELISPHTPELDAMLNLLSADKLPLEALPKLKTLLRNILDTEVVTPHDDELTRARVKRRRTLALDTLTLIEIRFEIPRKFAEFQQAQSEYDDSLNASYEEFEQCLKANAG